MTPPQARVVQAEADALAARTRLNGSVAAVQDRLSPATLVRGARRELAVVKRSARQAAGDDQRRLTIGGAAAFLMVLAVPFVRWRQRRRVAARAARIRGD